MQLRIQETLDKAMEELRNDLTVYDLNNDPSHENCLHILELQITERDFAGETVDPGKLIVIEYKFQDCLGDTFGLNFDTRVGELAQLPFDVLVFENVTNLLGSTYSLNGTHQLLNQTDGSLVFFDHSISHKLKYFHEKNQF